MTIQMQFYMIVPIFHKALKVFPELKSKLLTDKMLLGRKVYNIENIDTMSVTELQPKYVFTPMEMRVTAFLVHHSVTITTQLLNLKAISSTTLSNVLCTKRQLTLKMRQQLNKYCIVKLHSRQTTWKTYVKL